ncbi:uncharacterized protein [Epargyreus clarus]|uniref:uncharacterized protein n=1 Tax=Epargyreus clarus TaxID=520877 RepID=UPI003C300C50
MSYNNIAGQSSNAEQSDSNIVSEDKDTKSSSEDRQCWMNVDSKKHFAVMDKLDERYFSSRLEYQEAAKNDNFDGEMLAMLLKTKGAAEREIQKMDGDPRLIPAGISLGGYCMMRMPNSLLFFHRMKLRNDTHFRVTYLHNDLMNMVLHGHISLNDLHLLGSYDRSITDKDPSILYYTPTYGQVELLLKNVQYTMEGRYRLLKDRLTIELIISNIVLDDVMMTYLNNASSQPIRLEKKNIEEFLGRLQIDLDEWLKDYFNDYLMYFGLIGNKSDNKFQQYDKEKAIELNDYTDHVIQLVIRRLHKINAGSVKLPKFTIFTGNGMELVLKDGSLRGLDSIYRRSVATGKKEKDIRKIDAVVGFSNLKVTYQYEALIASNTPALSGIMIFSADELTARMSLALVENPESVDLQFEFLDQAKPESLTVEGAANRVISNFKYILEQHVIAIMSNTLIYNVRMLRTITRCVPALHGNEVVDDIRSEDELKQPTPPQHDALDEGTPLQSTETEEMSNGQTTIKAEHSDPNTNDENGENSEVGPGTNDENGENLGIAPGTNAENSDDSKLESGKKTGSEGESDAKDEETEDQASQETDQASQETDAETQDTETDTEDEVSRNTLFLVKDDSVELEIPSDEVKHREKMHLKYSENFTLVKESSE